MFQFLPLNPQLLVKMKMQSKAVLAFFFPFIVLLLHLQGDLDQFQRLTVDASKCLLEV